MAGEKQAPKHIHEMHTCSATSYYSTLTWFGGATHLNPVAIVSCLIMICPGRSCALIYFRSIVDANTFLLQVDLDSTALGKHFPHSCWKEGCRSFFFNLLHVSNYAELHCKWWMLTFTIRLFLFLHFSWEGQMFKFPFDWREHPTSPSCMSLDGVRRKPKQTWGEHENSTKKAPDCGMTVLLYYIILYYFSDALILFKVTEDWSLSHHSKHTIF